MDDLHILERSSDRSDGGARLRIEINALAPVLGERIADHVATIARHLQLVDIDPRVRADQVDRKAFDELDSIKRLAAVQRLEHEQRVAGFVDRQRLEVVGFLVI